MQRDPRTYLWDALEGANRINEFLKGISSEEYRVDEMLSSAVERQFMIIGEALNRLSQMNPDIADSIPELSRIVSFRNVLVHGYASIDKLIVWSVATEKLDNLIKVIHDLLEEK